MLASKPESESTEILTDPISIQAEKDTSFQINVRLLGATMALGLVIALVITAIIGASAYGGYRVGIGERSIIAATAEAEEWLLQYELALMDLEAGEYVRAGQRLEYIQTGCPDCAGVREKQSMVRDALDTPGIEQNATLPPQVNEVVDPEILLKDLLASYEENDWESVVLRARYLVNSYPEFEGAQVGGMLFVGLQNRGIHSIEDGVIELGLTDLERASEVGPLDAKARQYRHWASLYLSGMAFWGLHWPIVIDNLSLLHQTGPNFRDVETRLSEAYVAWGDELLLAGDACAAQIEFENAFSLAHSSDVTAKLLGAEQTCLHMTPEPTKDS